MIKTQLSIPLAVVGFDPALTILNQGTLYNSNKSIWQAISIDELIDKFIKVGIECDKNKPIKEVNDKTSTLYHEWQRARLGARTIVPDIDLIRLNDMGYLQEIIELKRSIISLDKWTPYRVDFPNFELLDTVAKKIGVPFTIVYNRKTKNSSNDDISKISVFSFRDKSCKLIRHYDWEDFKNGEYLHSAQPSNILTTKNKKEELG